MITVAMAAKRADRRRTFQKVRSESYHAGEREKRRWLQSNTFGKDEHNARMRALEEYDRKNREPGKRNGPLGHIALEVMRLMLRLRHRLTGRLDPSIAWLAAQLKRSRKAIVTAVGALRAHGFLDRQRRTELVDDPNSDQYVRQISNAYFFALPGKVAELVRRMRRQPTEAMRRMADAQARDADLAAKTTEQLIAEVEDEGLAALLGRMAKHLPECESPRGAE